MMIDVILAFLNDTRAGLLSKIENIENKYLTSRSSHDKWSVVDIIDHLGKTERFINIVLLRMKRNSKIEKENISEVEIGTNIINITYERFIGLTAFPGSEPDENVEYISALDKLTKVRIKTLEYLFEGRNSDFKNILFEHPYFGQINYYEWIYFVAKHEEGHTKQLNNNINELIG